MKLSLDLKTSLSQTLTPQQIQYLKLLQLPVIQLEQQVRQEIESNPMLEEIIDAELGITESGEPLEETDEAFTPAETDGEGKDAAIELKERESERYLSDDRDPFEFQKMFMHEDASYQGKTRKIDYEDDESEGFQISHHTSLAEDLIQQFRLVDLTREEFFLGEQIIGNIDNDGYLRRDLQEIVNETNALIAEINYNLENARAEQNSKNGNYENPARQFALSKESSQLLMSVYKSNPDMVESLKELVAGAQTERDDENGQLLKEVTMEQADKVLAEIRSLDPPGIGSRDVRECLLAQLDAYPKPNAAQKLAKEILQYTYDAFTKKHYNVIRKQLGVTDDYLREALEEIRSLNPKPGGGDYQAEVNTVIPDFVVDVDEESGELMITVNDTSLPSIRLNKAYEKMKKEAYFKTSNKETKDWVRNKYEDAKFLIQAIKQRKTTMLKVMTAIAHLQQDFFYYGPSEIKPLIYKNVADNTGLDISTVCRIVNGKYVQTPYGTYELKYFFSEALPTEEGEEVATRVIKQELKNIIDSESKKKPYSDDKLSQMLKDKGFRVARRTVAKYREQMKIPVARLRKEL